MINGATITIVGQLGGDPELRFTPTGKPVANFSVAVTLRKRGAESGEWIDANTTWYRIIAWDRLAENAAETLTRGARVVIVGTLILREWTNGEKSGQSLEINADAIGAELTNATAQITRKGTRETVPLPDAP
jgi:single-strand DNA-binding protein